MSTDNRNTLIWGGLALVAVATVFALAAKSGTRKSGTDSARDAFRRPDDSVHDLPSFSARLFNEKEDSPNPLSHAKPGVAPL